MQVHSKGEHTQDGRMAVRALRNVFDDVTIVGVALEELAVNERLQTLLQQDGLRLEASLQRVDGLQRRRGISVA